MCLDRASERTVEKLSTRGMCSTGADVIVFGRDEQRGTIEITPTEDV